MYALVIERLIMVDSSYGRSLNREEIFVEREHQMNCPDEDSPRRRDPHFKPIDCPSNGAPAIISEPMQQSILARLNEQGLNISYIDNLQAFMSGPGKRTQDRLRGSIGISRAVLLPTGSAVVTGRIWLGPRSAIENRYEFQRIDGYWRLARTDLVWIS